MLPTLGGLALFTVACSSIRGSSGFASAADDQWPIGAMTADESAIVRIVNVHAAEDTERLCGYYQAWLIERKAMPFDCALYKVEATVSAGSDPIFAFRGSVLPDGALGHLGDAFGFSGIPGRGSYRLDLVRVAPSDGARPFRIVIRFVKAPR